ncbi:YaaC family protein [Terrihalobacillus insolitus]|uniref:YaaC family protein n=1 Tax=Terrihalobacillus insolitus TaxID=2950438 RepID=UPI00233F8377|nr:YaaC family protein [Terrihalobacillus insolitus]MDC3414901.1 YaaC family protein [Terrihalobacillus insolitus]
MVLIDEITTFLTYLKSANTAQSYLHDCYHNNHVEGGEKKSFENAYRFIYYLEHGESFFATGKKADLITKPILYFYGMIHLLKACLLTQRPDYPENTSLLSHGVSTRKRKKQNYSFLQDEVKPQHNGLFPYFSTYLYGEKEAYLEKMDMNRLFHNIPEMRDMYIHYNKRDSMFPIGNYGDNFVTFPLSILDHYHTTEHRFIEKLQTSRLNIKGVHKQEKKLVVELMDPINPISNGPFYFHYQKQTFYFPWNRHYFLTFNEVMYHYLLLYNLSMICRYETEWWGDLIHNHPNEDYPFIQHFLDVTATKVPLMLGHYLLHLRKE